MHVLGVGVVVWVGGPVVCAMGRVSLRVGGHNLGGPGVVPGARFPT